MFEGLADEIVAQGRIASAALGRQLAAIHELSLKAPVPEFAAMELACLLGLSRFAAENQVRLAAELCERLPEVLAALTDATIDLARARVFADVLAALDADKARSVAVAVLPVAATKTVGQLRDILRRKALAIDPAFVTARRKLAESVRSVQLHAADDGTATLTAFGLDAVRATAAFARINAIARARHTGDEQGRADVFLELLEGQQQAATGVVQLEVTVETLAGLDDDPGRLGAYGPVAADIARQFAESHQDGQWQFAIRAADGSLLQQGLTRARPAPTAQVAHRKAERDAGSGEWPRIAMRDAESSTWLRTAKRDGANGSRAECGSVAGESVRAPEQGARDRFAYAALTRWIRLRDRTCRAPSCRRPAIQCQLDHTVRYTDGGTTCHGNLGALCEYHHRVKDQGGWSLVQTRPGHFTWISPLGRIYAVGPEPP